MSELEPKKSAFTFEFIAAKKAEKHPLLRYTTVKFDDEVEWARFLDWVFDEYRGPKGLRFSTSLAQMTIKVSPDLLEVAHTQFAMREVTPKDVEEHLTSLKGKWPFDPADLHGRHIPGLGHFRRSRNI